MSLVSSRAAQLQWQLFPGFEKCQHFIIQISVTLAATVPSASRTPISAPFESKRVSLLKDSVSCKMVLPGKPNWTGRLKYREVNCTEQSPSVRLPWPRRSFLFLVLESEFVFIGHLRNLQYKLMWGGKKARETWPRFNRNFWKKLPDLIKTFRCVTFSDGHM